MKKILLFFALIAFPFFVAQCFFNNSYGSEGVNVTGAFAYPTLKGMDTGAAYLDITNNSGAEIVLIGAETPVARAEIHDHIHENGIMRMRKLDMLAIAPGETKHFKPGGLHIMLFGINKQLEEGGTFPLTLLLKGGEKVSFTAKVEDRDIETAPAHH